MVIEVRELRQNDAVASFCCQSPPLQDFLRKYAKKNQFRYYIGTTYVAVDPGMNSICGYVTLSMTSINVPNAVRERYRWPRYPIPALLIARLATETNHQGKGVGSRLLRFSLKKVLTADVGCAGACTDAKPEAVAFYEKYGFEVLEQSSYTTQMFLGRKAIAGTGSIR